MEKPKGKIYRPKRLTPEEIERGCTYLNNGNPTETKLCVIAEEFRQGLYFVKEYSKSVTFFGSARTKPHEEIHKKAYDLAAKVVKETGYAVISGGGHGIMGAVSLGAYDAGGKSIGITIKLPYEQTTNPWVTDKIDFTHFFSRKVTLSYGSEAYIFFPGGYGTMDELFELLTLKQTNKIEPVPIVLFDSSFWNPLRDVLFTITQKYNTISEEEFKIFTITDDMDEVINIIKSAPVRN